MKHTHEWSREETDSLTGQFIWVCRWCDDVAVPDDDSPLDPPAAIRFTPEPYRYLALIGGETIYRIQPDGTTHFVGPRGDWEVLPYKWLNSLDLGALRKTAAQAEAQRRKRSGNDDIDELGLYHGGSI